MVEPDCRRVLDAFADAVIAADSMRRIVYINAAAEKLLGWPAHELVGQPLTTVVPPRFHALHTAGFDRYLATRQPKLIGHPVQVPALRRDGSEVAIELTLSAVRVDDDDLFVASLRDLQERIELANCLQATNRVATAIATLTDPDKILRAAVDALVSDFGAVLAQAWFYDPTSNLLNLRWRGGQLAVGDTPQPPAAELPSYPLEICEVMRTRQPLIVPDVQRDTRFDRTWIAGRDVAALAAFPLVHEHEVSGVLVYCSRQPLYDEVAQALISLAGIVAACLTNTHLLASAQAARVEAEASQQRFHDLVQGLDAIVWEADARTGQHTFISKRVEDILGYPAERWLQEPNFWTRLVHPEDRERVVAWYYAAAQSTEEQDIEYRAVTAGDQVVWLHDTAAVIRDSNGVSKQLRGLTVDVTERKRTQDSLRESEERFRTMADSAPVLLWMSGTDGQCFYFNQPWLDFTGRTLEQEVGNGWAEGVHPDDRQRCLDIYVSAFAERRRFSMEYRLQRADGIYRWVLDNGVPRHMPDGSFAGYIGSCIDITERKQAEEDLHTTYQALQAVISASPLAIMAVDLHETITIWNPAAERIFGWSIGAVLGRRLSSLFSDSSEVWQKVRRHIWQQGGSAGLEVQLSKKDGAPVDIDISTAPFRDPNGAISGVVAVIADVSERKQAEKTQQFLSEASTLLASSLDYETTLARLAQLTVPVLADWCIIDVVEGDGAIRSMAMAHVDARKEQIIRSLRQQYPLESSQHHPVRQVLRSGRSRFIPEVTEEDLAAITQAEHLASIHELAMKSAMFVPLVVRGRVLGAITFASARPEQRYGLGDLMLAEELARRAAIAVENARLYSQAQQAILARDEFLSIASHELKTPLTSLKLQLQSLLRSARKGVLARADRERLAGKLQNADEQIQRIAQLVEQLLDVTRIRAGRIDLQLQAADLVDIVRDTVARFEEQLEQARCAVNVYADAAIIDRWDRGRIDQIVSNLLSNAIKYGSGKPIEITVTADTSKAAIAVRDFGIGIATEHLERIFVRFERAVSAQHYGGLGLGLYIVRQTVDALGGSIRVTSTPGVETTFTVELPRNRGAS